MNEPGQQPQSLEPLAGSYRVNGVSWLSRRRYHWGVGAYGA